MEKLTNDNADNVHTSSTEGWINSLKNTIKERLSKSRILERGKKRKKEKEKGKRDPKTQKTVKETFYTNSDLETY